MTRLGLFIFYDNKGIADKTTTLLLEEIQKYVERLVIVCNGHINPQSRKLLQAFSQEILVREHEDFDFYATREGLELIGWNNLKSYDELVILNSSIVGPVNSFENMFAEMERRECDFWGITKYHSKHGSYLDKYIVYDELPDYIQTYFYAIRKKMLSSYEFKTHWYPKKKIKDRYEAAGIHEAVFTKKFCDYGFLSDVYINTERYRELTENAILWIPEVLIREMKCPVFLKESILGNSYEANIKNTRGRGSILLLDELASVGFNTDNLIELILRTDNLYDIQKRFNCNKVFSDLHGSASCASKKMALFVKVSEVLFFNTVYRYIQKFCKVLDIYLLVEENDYQKIDEEITKETTVLTYESDKQVADIQKKLFSVTDETYEYIGFITIEQSAKLQFIQSEIERFQYMLDNILANKDYLENILQFLSENDRVYAIIPLSYSRGFHNPILNQNWIKNFNFIQSVSKKLDLVSAMNKPAVSNESGWFLCKAHLLKDFISFAMNESILEDAVGIRFEDIYINILALYAQSRGYYHVNAINEKNLLEEYTGMQYYFERMAAKENYLSYWKLVDKHK